MRTLAFVTAGVSDPGTLGWTLTNILAVLRTSPEVARVELDAGGETLLGSPGTLRASSSPGYRATS